MTLNLKRQPPWLLDGTYYRSLPTNDERAGGEEPFRNCVVSLHVAKSDDEESGEDGLTQVGTAFAVSVPDGEGQGFRYLISTREVVRRCIRHGDLILRFSTSDGGSLDVATVPYDDWYPHPDPRSDIAAHPLKELPPGVDLTPVPMEIALTDDLVSSQHVGTGDSLFSVGQFEPHPQNSGPRPLISNGSVYLMPQLVATRLAGPDSAFIEVEGYLAEWRSWAGASGSPVFRYSPSNTSVSGSHVYLLGVVHSHMNADEPQAMSEVLVRGDVHEEYGLAVVVPARRVREVLETGPLAQARDEAIEEIMIERMGGERMVVVEELMLKQEAH